MITCTIAFDSTQILARRIRIDDSQVNPETGNTYLRMRDPAFCVELFRYRLLERGVKKT